MLKAIPNLDGYYASSDGRIWSTKSNSWRKPQMSKNGYSIIRVNKENFYVHRLVALAFIPNPDNLETVDHVNTIKTDNRPENLRWMTRSENSSIPNRKRTKPIICIETGEIFKSLKECSIKMKLGNGNICSVLKGKLPHTGGYTFKYV